MYNMFVKKASSILDLKAKVASEFGYEISQILLYFNYTLIKDIVYLNEI